MAQDKESIAIMWIFYKLVSGGNATGSAGWLDYFISIYQTLTGKSDCAHCGVTIARVTSGNVFNILPEDLSTWNGRGSGPCRLSISTEEDAGFVQATHAMYLPVPHDFALSVAKQACTKMDTKSEIKGMKPAPMGIPYPTGHEMVSSYIKSLFTTTLPTIEDIVNKIHAKAQCAQISMLSILLRAEKDLDGREIYILRKAARQQYGLHPDSLKRCLSECRCVRILDPKTSVIYLNGVKTPLTNISIKNPWESSIINLKELEEILGQNKDNPHGC